MTSIAVRGTEKWCKGIITKVLGPLNYEINIAGYTHQAHIDHILPCPQTTDSSSPGDISSHQDEDDIIMPIVSCEASTDTAELVTLRPHRSCQPPKRLINEMD